MASPPETKASLTAIQNSPFARGGPFDCSDHILAPGKTLGCGEQDVLGNIKIVEGRANMNALLSFGPFKVHDNQKFDVTVLRSRVARVRAEENDPTQTK